MTEKETIQLRQQELLKELEKLFYERQALSKELFETVKALMEIEDTEEINLTKGRPFTIKYF